MVEGAAGALGPSSTPAQSASDKGTGGDSSTNVKNSFGNLLIWLLLGIVAVGAAIGLSMKLRKK